MMRICIDAGHGGEDPGAIGVEPYELQERDVTLSVALLLEEELRSRGDATLMTRRIDCTFGLRARADLANRHEAALFISVHANAAGSSTADLNPQTPSRV